MSDLWILCVWLLLVVAWVKASQQFGMWIAMLRSDVKWRFRPRPVKYPMDRQSRVIRFEKRKQEAARSC